MKRIFFGVGVAILIVAVGVGGYFIGISQNSEDVVNQKNEEQNNQNKVISKTKEELTAMLKQKTSKEIVFFDYDDYDSDGKYEVFALMGKKDDENGGYGYIGELWFINDKEATLIKEENRYIYLNTSYGIDNYNVSGDSNVDSYLRFDGKKFLQLTQNWYGPGTTSYVWSVENNKCVEQKISNKAERISQIDDKNFIIVHSTYDGITDISNGYSILHTFKAYTFYYDNGFKEYGAIEITKENLLEFKGASEILENKLPKNAKIKNILYRQNNKIDVNYYVIGTYNTQNNYFIKLKYDANSVECIDDDDSPSGNAGYYLKALIPEIATYPTEFIHPLK